MKLLDRYIAKSVLSAISLVTLMLAGLQVFILFVNQLDDLGKFDFGIFKAAIYVFLQMPYQVYLFFPMASLLGSLVGLGVMANNRELIVMRAAGVSVDRITFSVLKAAIILIISVTLIGETIVPKLAYFANDLRLQALSNGQALRTANGVWLRYKNDYLAIGRVLPDNSLENVFQFRFDKTHHLRQARKIKHIVYIHGQWIAHEVEITEFSDEQTQVKRVLEMPWEVTVKPGILSANSSEPDEMTLYELRQYLHVQKKNHQTALNYQLAFWQRIFQPLTTLVMMILAIPFIFGPLRSSTMGSKLLTGAVVGFGFHIINRFFGPASQVLQWPPVVAALGPTLVFALLGLYLMKKVK